MKQNFKVILFLFGLLLYLNGCEEIDPDSYQRHDKAIQIDIQLSGSLQNPAFSPDGKSIVFTRFRNGYNIEPADIFIYNLENKSLDTLVMDGSANVNLPGSCWNKNTKSIVFSSSREPHDEIYIIEDSANPGDEIRSTFRDNFMAYEPSFSPDGEWIVFESHPLDIENEGVIMKYKLDKSSAYQSLTEASNDCRQPNWSPSGNYILYQKYENKQWDIWIMKPDGSNKTKVTSGNGDKTDASFSNDGQYIIYSCDDDLEFANIFRISVNGGNSERLTNYEGYDGAPSISPDGKKLTYESYGGDPDDSKGTSLYFLSIEK